MNMEFHARDYSSAAQLLADAKERRNRMERAGRLPQMIEKLERALNETRRERNAYKGRAEQANNELERLKDELKEAHRTIEHLRLLVEQDTDATPLRRHPFDIAKQFLAANYPTVTLEDVLCNSRVVRVVRARQAVYRHVHEERPDLSVAALARRFKRDHTSILHALKVTAPKGEDA